MQTKIIAGPNRGFLFPQKIKVAAPEPLTLQLVYTYSDSNREYEIRRGGWKIGYLDWYLTETELVLSSIQLNDGHAQAFEQKVDATHEGSGSALVRHLLGLAATLRKQDFVIWNTRNYALLHLARQLSPAAQYILQCKNGYDRHELCTWADLWADMREVYAEFMLGGRFRKVNFMKNSQDLWQASRKDEPYRLEFTLDNYANVYYTGAAEHFLVPKPQISLRDARFDIIIPVGENNGRP
jgi:hypothetical protein